MKSEIFLVKHFENLEPKVYYTVKIVRKTGTQVLLSSKFSDNLDPEILRFLKILRNQNQRLVTKSKKLTTM
jgi:hypothetical protein